MENWVHTPLFQPIWQVQFERVVSRALNRLVANIFWYEHVLGEDMDMFCPEFKNKGEYPVVSDVRRWLQI